MNRKTLVIMAAGMGSRFGGDGSKQTAFVDGKDNCIFHFSITDAIAAGFEKVVLIIRKKDQELFDNLIKDKFDNRIAIEYAYQEMDDLKSQEKIPEERTKPLGTVHAILCAADLIEGDNFAVINADDYYGRDSFEKGIKLLENGSNSIQMVTFKAGNTLSENGEVKRGVCKVEGDKVTKIEECKLHRNEEGKIIAKPLFTGEEEYEISNDTPVSMQFFVFPRSILKSFEEHFVKTINDPSFDKMTGELILVETIDYIRERTGIEMTMEQCGSIWMGLTYKEDLPGVKKKIAELYDSGLYQNLHR